VPSSRISGAAKSDASTAVHAFEHVPLGFHGRRRVCGFHHRSVGFIYLKIDDYLTARSDRVITAQLEGIAALPPERRLEAIDERLRQDPRGVQLAAIFAADGHRITGNLESLPSDLRIDAEAQAPTSSGPIATAASTKLSVRSRGACETATCWCWDEMSTRPRRSLTSFGQALALGPVPGFSLCLAGRRVAERARAEAGRRGQPGGFSASSPVIFASRLPHRTVD